MTETTITYKKGKLYQLDLTQLQADPNQPRKYVDPQALDELAASIVKHGVLEPILFRAAPATTQNSELITQNSELKTNSSELKTKNSELITKNSELKTNSSELKTKNSELITNNSLFIVAGERRVEAAKKAGLTTIPAIAVEGNHAEIAIVENLLRQDLTAVEEAEALQALLTEQNYTQEQLAGVIGKARVTVTEILTLNRLPQEIRDECRSSSTAARRTLVEIARKKQVRSMITAWNAYKAKLAKQAAGNTRQAKTPETPEDVIAWLGKSADKLESLDTSTWAEDQQNSFGQSLVHLQESIQAILNPVGPDNLL